MQQSLIALAVAALAFNAGAQDYGQSPQLTDPHYGYESVSPSSPAYRQASGAQAEERLTAERLAAQMRGTPATQTRAMSVNQVPPQPYGSNVIRPASGNVTYAPTVAATLPAEPMIMAGTPSGADPITEPTVPPMPAARPGECFALVRTPEQYRSVERQYVSVPGYDRVETTTGRYQTQQQEVVTAESYERMEVTPATFKMVTETVEVRPPTVRYVSTEPQYEYLTEKVLEKPARQVWKRGRGPIERMDNATGEIMCLIEEPAVYKTVSRRVLKKQPEVREVQVPGEYRTVTRRVMDQPAQVRKVTVPAERGTVVVTRELEKPAAARVRVPDQMATYAMRELAAPATLEWRPVLCETNLTPDVIRRVQEALRKAGYDPGASDGRFGASTLRALNAYQRANGLPTDTYINIETARALGVV